MKKTVWTFGLISGVILSIMMAATVPFHDGISYDRAMIIGYTTMVLSFLLIFFGVRSYRDNVGGGRVGFGRAFAVGTLIAVIASVCYVATWEVIYYKFMPDYMDKYAARSIEQIKKSGASSAPTTARLPQEGHCSRSVSSSHASKSRFVGCTATAPFNVRRWRHPHHR